MRALPLVAALLLLGTGAVAQQPTAQTPASRDVATLLFETPQWAQAPAETDISYRYARKGSNPTLHGASFEDRIRLHIEKGDQAENRTVRVEMFSGEHRQAAGPFADVTTNPVLLIFLEHHVQQLAKLLHANPRYLKNAIRTAWREKADVSNSETTIGDRRLSATRIVVKPFVDDPNKARMNGLEGLTYTVAISDSVPGRIADIHISAPLNDGTVGLDERLVYEPKQD